MGANSSSSSSSSSSAPLSLASSSGPARSNNSRSQRPALPRMPPAQLLEFTNAFLEVPDAGNESLSLKKTPDFFIEPHGTILEPVPHPPVSAALRKSVFIPSPAGRPIDDKTTSKSQQPTTQGQQEQGKKPELKDEKEGKEVKEKGKDATAAAAASVSPVTSPPVSPRKGKAPSELYISQAVKNNLHLSVSSLPAFMSATDFLQVMDNRFDMLLQVRNATVNHIVELKKQQMSFKKALQKLSISEPTSVHFGIAMTAAIESVVLLMKFAKAQDPSFSQLLAVTMNRVLIQAPPLSLQHIDQDLERKIKPVVDLLNELCHGNENQGLNMTVPLLLSAAIAFGSLEQLLLVVRKLLGFALSKSAAAAAAAAASASSSAASSTSPASDAFDVADQLKVLTGFTPKPVDFRIAAIQSTVGNFITPTTSCVTKMGDSEMLIINHAINNPNWITIQSKEKVLTVTSTKLPVWQTPFSSLLESKSSVFEIIPCAAGVNLRNLATKEYLSLAASGALSSKPSIAASETFKFKSLDLYSLPLSDSQQASSAAMKGDISQYYSLWKIYQSDRTGAKTVVANMPSSGATV